MREEVVGIAGCTKTNGTSWQRREQKVVQRAEGDREKRTGPAGAARSEKRSATGWGESCLKVLISLLMQLVFSLVICMQMPEGCRALNKNITKTCN